MTGQASAALGSEAHRLRLYRYLARTGVIGALIGLTSAGIAVASGPSGYRPGFTTIAFAVQIVATMWVIADLLRGRPNTFGLQLYVVSAVLLEIAHIWVWRPPSPHLMPPLFHTLVVGMCLAPLAFRRPRVAIALQVAHAVAYAIVRAPQMGLAVVPDAGVTLAAGLACTAAMTQIDAVLANLETFSRREHETAQERASRDARRAAVADWHMVLHGKVIASLMAAAAQSPGAAVAARKALEALEPASIKTGTFHRELREVAALHGLDLAMTVHGAPDNERIERVLVGCVKELLVNVARHSGQSRVHVRADFSAKKWNVTVTDPGTGFDRSAISPDHGLVVNVQNPWESVGGHLDLPRSIQGTTVTLTWEAPAVPTWQPKSFKPLLLIVIVSLSCHSVLGWIFSDFVYSTWLLAAGILAIWLLTASAVICHSRACFVAVALGTITWSSVMGANLAFPIELDWRIWFGGALSGLCGVLAFRSRFRLALLSVLGSYAVVAFTLVAESATVWTTVQMAGAYVGPLLATIPARVGPLVDQARDQVVHEVRLADQELENTITVSAREAQWGAHSDVIQTHVVPMLRRIANDQVLSSADRRLCRKLELTCRDIIRAASITDNELTEHAVKARLAGAEFSPAITAKASIVIAESLRRLAVGLLPKLGRGDLLTLDCDGRTGSIFLRMNHAPLPPVAHEATAQLRQLGLSVTPDIRETWAIIEVTHFDHQP